MQKDEIMVVTAARATIKKISIEHPHVAVLRLHEVGPVVSILTLGAWQFARSARASLSSMINPNAYTVSWGALCAVYFVRWLYLQCRERASHPLHRPIPMAWSVLAGALVAGSGAIVPWVAGRTAEMRNFEVVADTKGGVDRDFEALAAIAECKNEFLPGVDLLRRARPLDGAWEPKECGEIIFGTKETESHHFLTASKYVDASTARAVELCSPEQRASFDDSLHDILQKDISGQKEYSRCRQTVLNAADEFKDNFAAALCVSRGSGDRHCPRMNTEEYFAIAIWLSSLAGAIATGACIFSGAMTRTVAFASMVFCAMYLLLTGSVYSLIGLPKANVSEFTPGWLTYFVVGNLWVIGCVPYSVVVVSWFARVYRRLGRDKNGDLMLAAIVYAPFCISAAHWLAARFTLYNLFAFDRSLEINRIAERFVWTCAWGAMTFALPAMSRYRNMARID